MKNSPTFKRLLFAAFVTVGVFYFLKKQPQSPSLTPLTLTIGQSETVGSNSSHPQPISSEKRSKVLKTGTKKDKDPLILTAGNFENLVQRCFAGDICEIFDDPWKIYQQFKSSGNTRANDQLISFLRSKLRDAKLRNKYKIAVKRMIDDFYPKSEKQFQNAAYYAYLGDLQKSLGIYLDLEKQAAQDPSLRPAPKLNIANVFYEQGRLAEALPYFRAAANDLISGRVKMGNPGTGVMMDSINARIDEIEKKLNLGAH